MVELFAGPLGPILIFAIRVTDVSMATVRTVLIMRGQKFVAPLIGFAESLLWVLAVSAAIGNLGSALHIIGYAAGFATGNLVGLLIEERLALGLTTLRIFSQDSHGEVARGLRAMGHGATEFRGRGHQGPVRLIYSLVKRRELVAVIEHVERTDPDAFVAIDDSRAVRRGWMFQKRRK